MTEWQPIETSLMNKNTKLKDLILENKQDLVIARDITAVLSDAEFNDYSFIDSIIRGDGYTQIIIDNEVLIESEFKCLIQEAERENLESTLEDLLCALSPDISSRMKAILKLWVEDKEPMLELQEIIKDGSAKTFVYKDPNPKLSFWQRIKQLFRGRNV